MSDEKKNQPESTPSKPGAGTESIRKQVARAMAPLFPMGQIVATRGFLALCEEHQANMREAGIEFLLDHSLGKWGELCDDDIYANQEALRNGGRVLSKYRFHGTPLYVITEADRTATTILLCDEY
ncbi:type I restriction endonuclease subunit M [Burkholderia vietnamiensis]|uniref:Type I restriction endonuclease subunit M n=1 Tax=Burkholderia vietnamiensis (strain G4 / LMG 22486) TaxID=269482 RepID=A4JFH3_BURVG|nr:conserved hypothetical protein [Burkholderia vietnamiensis G4]MCB4344785.1 type I restriction endonuclease subunit M [Burkholderia vietnamiensis]